MSIMKNISEVTVSRFECLLIGTIINIPVEKHVYTAKNGQDGYIIFEYNANEFKIKILPTKIIVTINNRRVEKIQKENGEQLIVELNRLVDEYEKR